MTIAILKIKIMPEQGINKEELEKALKETIEKINGKLNKIEEQEVAFGLKAIIATFVWPESQETSLAEEAIKNISGVSSLDIIDYRRAFG